MSNFQLTTPVAILIFNRPDTTARVFEQVRRAQPPRLYVAGDGPRSDDETELARIQQARDIVMDGVDWPCEVKTLFRDRNLGCKQAVSGALAWLFQHEEAGIILEDDCVPHPTFFRFCEELLERYLYDTRVMAISGDYFLGRRIRMEPSYYFSRYFRCWGWATWRRAHSLFDPDLSLWPQVRQSNWLRGVFRRERELGAWSDIFQSVYDKRIDTWDYGWSFMSFIQSGFTITPTTNLVMNIGFGSEATHTKKSSTENMIPSSPMTFPLQHPPVVLSHFEADRMTSTKRFPPLGTRIARKLRRGISRIANYIDRG